jgi:beta-phosphoglucomutase-like phosphatase (HAD superfamily)
MTAQQPLRAVVFDLDGTILDTEDAIMETWLAMYTECGLPFPRKQFTAMIGTWTPGWDPYAPLLAGRGARAQRQLRRRKEQMEAKLVARLGPRPGIVTWLCWCERAGIPVGCASSSPLAWVRGQLDRLGLAQHFQSIVAREHVRSVKPAPDLFRQAVAELGVPARAALAVEDSLPGVLSAKAAGLVCALYPNFHTALQARREADLVVNPAGIGAAQAFAAGLAAAHRRHAWAQSDPAAEPGSANAAHAAIEAVYRRPA